MIRVCELKSSAKRYCVVVAVVVVNGSVVSRRSVYPYYCTCNNERLLLLSAFSPYCNLNNKHWDEWCHPRAQHVLIVK